MVEADEAEKRCQGNPAWDLPMVTGPIAVAYKLAGVDSLTVTPEVAAKIFSGQITTWDDAAIKKVNPGVNLPAADQGVLPLRRVRHHGELHQVAEQGRAAWTAEPGKKWTGKGEGKEKSAGVTDGVNASDGGITYVEWSYAATPLGIAKVDNGGGAVELTAGTVAKAVERRPRRAPATTCR